MQCRIVTAVCWGLLLLTVEAEPQLRNGIAAIVNGTAITYKEVELATKDNLEFLANRYATRPDIFERERRRLLERRIEELVETRLILEEFRTAGYNLPEAAIDSRIQKEIRNTYRNRLTLMKTLQNEGLTYEAFRKKIREKIIVEVMVDHFVPRDPVISPLRIDKYYQENQDQFKLPDQVQLRMITLPNRPGQGAASNRQLAREIIAKLDEGAPFADMAKIYSQDANAAEGGLRELEDRTVLRAEISDLAFAMKKGERSDVIETPEACYIFLVEESKPAHVRPVAELREDIERTLKTEETRRLHKQWIDRLKNKNFVRYF